MTTPKYYYLQHAMRRFRFQISSSGRHHSRWWSLLLYTPQFQFVSSTKVLFGSCFHFIVLIILFDHRAAPFRFFRKRAQDTPGIPTGGRDHLGFSAHHHHGSRRRRPASAPPAGRQSHALIEMARKPRCADEPAANPAPTETVLRFLGRGFAPYVEG